MLKSTFVNLSPKEEQQYGNFKKYWRILKNTVFVIYKVIFVPIFLIFFGSPWKGFCNDSVGNGLGTIGKWTWVVECTLVNPYVSLAIEV